MRRTALTTSLSTEVMRRLRHFGDFVTVPLAIVIFVGLAGVYRLYLVLVGVAAWTLLEYLVHRIVFHHYSAGRRLHRLHHDHPNDPDAQYAAHCIPDWISADCHRGGGRWVGDFRRTSLGVSSVYRCPLCGAPLADRAKLLALFSKGAAPYASSLRKL